MTVRARILLALFCALAAATLTVSLVAALGWPLWQENGVSLCAATGGQEDPQIASDGSGGAIVTWCDERSEGNYDIYAQRVDAAGNALWDTDGVSLCAATDGQHAPQIASDGSGGAIVTWYDYRGSDEDIYAQRVDATGNTLWETNGVSLCVATDHQHVPQIVSNGSGGAIVTWYDYRDSATTGYDIYAQRVDADGNALWDTDGVSLCVATKSQYNPQIATDGSGGAIFVWEDCRSVSGYADIYAQRVDADGNALWDTDGVSLCVASKNQFGLQVVSDGSGGAIVTWQDERTGSYDIYARRVDGDGNALWVADGVSLCFASNNQWSPQIASDWSGGAIVTWYDYRGSDEDIYAQRVDADGNALWDTDGVSLCVATNSQYSPQIAPDGSGGAIVTWQDQRSLTPNGGGHIYAQRVDADGNALWVADGVRLCVASNYQSGPQIVSDGSGGAIVTWKDERDWATTAADIYAQRVGDVTPLYLPLVMRKYP